MHSNKAFLCFKNQKNTHYKNIFGKKKTLHQKFLGNPGGDVFDLLPIIPFQFFFQYKKVKEIKTKMVIV